jgi:hypothetical protein
MKLSLAKKMVCEMGDVVNFSEKKECSFLERKDSARRMKERDEAGRVERYAYPMQAPFKLVDDQSNIREIVKKNPYKKDNYNA